MATIETKYSIGDKVFHASIVMTQKQHPCPDCLGTKKWSAASPAGKEYTFACPRCSSSYMSDRDLSLTYSSYEPTASALTIGSVRHDSANSEWRDGSYIQAPKTEYMCRETGIGSGGIYAEDRLFLTEEEAMTSAQLMADDANSKNEWVVSQYNKTLSISDNQIESAMIKLAKDAHQSARSSLYSLGYLFEKIEEAADKEEILQEVEFYKNYSWKDDKENIDATRSLLPTEEA